MIEYTEYDKRFYLAESTIPDAGLGVFAARPIKKGEHLAITGVKVKRNSIADKCTHYANDYKFALQYGPNYTHLVIPMGFSAIVNHGDKETRNCDLTMLIDRKNKKRHEKLVYYFIRDVKKDEEILGNYGFYGKVLEWAGERVKILKDVQDEWSTFLSYDLYNLGTLLEV